MTELWWLVPVAAVLLWGLWTFNRLVALRNRVHTAWSDIDVQLSRRHALVPRLVETVSAYARHEKALLEAVTELRGRAQASEQPEALAAIEDQLQSRLQQVFILQEAYPDLKADRNFAQLQTELVDTEDQLQYARRYYNGAVRALNDRVMQFPDLLVARLLGFNSARFFSAEDPQRQASHIKGDMFL